MAHRGGYHGSGYGGHATPASRSTSTHQQYRPSTSTTRIPQPAFHKNVEFFRAHPHFESRRWYREWRPLAITLPALLTGVALNAFLWDQYAAYFDAGWRWDPRLRVLVPPGWVFNPVLNAWVPSTAFIGTTAPLVSVNIATPPPTVPVVAQPVLAASQPLPTSVAPIPVF